MLKLPQPMLKFVDHLQQSLKYFKLCCKYSNIVENIYVELQRNIVATNGAAALTEIIVDSTCVL